MVRAGTKHVIAGHMWYGMHEYVRNPLYITCLRKPLATVVSSQLYINRKLLRKATDEDAAAMVKEWLSPIKASDNFVKRLTGAQPKTGSELVGKATDR